MAMPVRFLYFDLGKVLVDFSVEQMCRQVAVVSGLEPAVVREAIFADGLQERYERGEVSDRQFYDLFCQRTQSRADLAALRQAANDIFTLNMPIVPLVAQLAEAGYRLGILSNTCEGHWEHCRRRFRILESAPLHALSYRIGACKPVAAIFRAAAELADCQPAEIFYVDDIAGHVEGARAVGFDAVRYTSTAALAAELRQRGLEFNY
jgi:HAD superfamily hydrolase (TIGR01509 family)